MKQKRNYKEIFKNKWYTEEEINNHYEYIKVRNDNNKVTYKKFESKYKVEIEKAKKFFKKVKVSLKWDWIWVETTCIKYDKTYTRMFIYFTDLDNAIKMYK